MSGEGGETGEGANKTVRMVRFSDAGTPVSVESAEAENVWAIGRPDYKRNNFSSVNLRTEKDLKPGDLFQAADGRVMEVTNPSKSAAGAGQAEVAGSIYVRTVLKDEADKIRSEGKSIPTWEELQEK
ncbi:MAG: hypothetical protein WCV86_05310 [Patescibacteria group bacterium]